MDTLYMEGYPMKHRFVLSLVLVALLMSTAILLGFHLRRNAEGYLGPASISASRNSLSYIAFSSPGWLVLNLSCNGNGDITVENTMSKRIVFKRGLHGHFTTRVLIPEEGDYILYTNGSAMCLAHFRGVYPTTRVQDVYYLMGGFSAFLLAFLLWKWWR